MSSVRVTVADMGGTPLSKTVKGMGRLVPTGRLVLRAQGATPTDENWFAACHTGLCHDVLSWHDKCFDY